MSDGCFTEIDRVVILTSENNFVNVYPFLNPHSGAGLLILLIVLWVTLIVRGAICKKHRIVEKSATSITRGAVATPARGRDDAMHGTPPGDGSGQVGEWLD